MKKFMIISLIVLALLFTAGIVYLNNLFLPRTIKALIVKGIEERTNARVSLGSLKVNIFKGLVLTDLAIYQQANQIIKVKEASCIVVPFPLLRKQIIIPLINIKSSQIFLERRSDNTFNLTDLFSPPASSGAPAVTPAKPAANPSTQGFSVFIYRVNLSNAKVIFKDSTFTQPFTKTLENLNVTVYLSMPEWLLSPMEPKKRK